MFESVKLFLGLVEKCGEQSRGFICEKIEGHSGPHRGKKEIVWGYGRSIGDG